MSDVSTEAQNSNLILHKLYSLCSLFSMNAAAITAKVAQTNTNKLSNCVCTFYIKLFTQIVMLIDICNEKAATILFF